MYRLCLLFILSTFVQLTSHGQFTIMAESQKFDEIEDGLNKTIILQDGTTCNLTIYRDSKIEVRTFDKNFNQLISKSVTTQFGYLGIGADLAAIFEANQQIVLFITCCELSVPTAYRIVIDPLHGTIIKQDKLWFDENKKDRARDYSLAGMSVMLPVIAIRFDPITQNYVSCFLNTTEPPDKRALEVYVFNKNHELIHTHILNWGSKNIYDYIRILDMVITGEKAYIALQAYNSSVVHKDIGTNIIIDCSKEGTQTEFVKIEAETDMTMGGALINYNPADKKVYLLTQYFITRKMKKEDNNIFETANKMYVYDPASKKVEKGKPVSAPGVLDFEKSIARFYFHSDGTYSMIYELRDHNVDDGVKKIMIMNDYGKQLPEVVTLSERPYAEKKLTVGLLFDWGQAYRRYFYIKGPANSFVIVNDEFENEKRIEEGKRMGQIKDNKECSAFYFDVSSGLSAPKRSYLFESNEAVVMNTSSYYDAQTQIYVTLKKERKGKKASLVWMKVN